MVLRLADFCRATLTRNESDKLTVADCFERISLYLNIEKVRWKESLRVDLQLEEQARGIRIPPFFLQPLVENAIKYGGSTSPDELHVKVSARIDAAAPAARWLVLEVANTGEWIEPSVARAQGNTGLGLTNLQERLKRTFPDAFELTTKASDGWVVVRIRLRLAEDSRQPEPQDLQNPS
jgi:LytS/YehU family sensor histidine kinase